MDVDGHVAPSEVGNIFLFVLSFESLASIFMLFHCLIAEAPRKLVRRFFSYSNQHHGSEG